MNSWLSQSWCRKDTCECICRVTFRLLQWVTGWSTWQTAQSTSSRHERGCTVDLSWPLIRTYYAFPSRPIALAAQSRANHIQNMCHGIQGSSWLGAELYQRYLCSRYDEYEEIVTPFCNWWSTCYSKDIDKSRRSSFCSRRTQAWNKLPAYARQSPSLETFKRTLKTHLFTVSFPSWCFTLVVIV